MTEQATTRKVGSLIGYDKEREKIAALIEQDIPAVPRHLAIIGDPLSGKTTVAGELLQRYGDHIHSLSLDRVIVRETLPDFSATGKEWVLVDNCEYLATRQIGGFDLLDEFLRAHLTSGKRFITIWNSHAWRYLNAVRDIGTYYPEVITLPAMDPETIRQLVRSRYQQQEIRFIDEAPKEPEKIFTLVDHKITLPFSKKEHIVPFLHLNTSVLRARLRARNAAETSPEDEIFKKLHRVAGGNPGVAMDVFAGCLDEGSISLQKVPEDDCALSLDITESFILALILSANTLHYQDLSAMVWSRANFDRALYRLLQQGLILERCGSYRVSPVHMVCVTKYLKKNQRLW